MRIIPLSILLLFSITNFVLGENVFIPDKKFKEFLIGTDKINTNNDDEIQVSEAEAFSGGIHIKDKGIYSIVGIEAFKEITVLDCSFNQLVELNLSFNKSLKVLACRSNKIIELDVSNNPNLTIINCMSNQISTLILGYKPYLIELFCDSNNLNVFDLDSCVTVETILCSFNKLTSLNLKNNSELTFLKCIGNQLSELDINSNIKLNELHCSENKLSLLNVQNNKELTIINCGKNFLYELDVRWNKKLKELYCNGNLITTLNMSKNIDIAILECHINQLTQLNLKNNNNKKIISISAYWNHELRCIQVDDEKYSKSKWVSDGKFNRFDFDDDNLFNNDCQYITDIDVMEDNEDFNIFPNPTIGNLRFNKEINVQITNIVGQILIERFNTIELDITLFPKGLYFVYSLSSNNRIVSSNLIFKE